MSRSRTKRPPAPLPSPHPRFRTALTCAAAAATVAIIAAAVAWFRGEVPSTPTTVRKPNVLLITLDTTRADRLRSYGYATAATPNLDRLAAGGVRFEQALSSTPLTLPSHASLFTGLLPHQPAQGGPQTVLGRSLLGEPEVPLSTLRQWVAEWVRGGGASLNKPTHFEVTDGRF